MRVSQEVDTDRSGYISLQEFLTWFRDGVLHKRQPDPVKPPKGEQEQVSEASAPSALSLISPVKSPSRKAKRVPFGCSSPRSPQRARSRVYTHSIRTLNHSVSPSRSKVEIKSNLYTEKYEEIDLLKQKLKAAS